MSEEIRDIQTLSGSQNQTSSYRSIFKATSLFGGVQVYQIIVQIIRSKFVAVLLGPEGVGIIGLFQSGLQLVQNLTSFGLASSGVRDVSEANGTNDTKRISTTVTVVRRLVWITGLLGLIAVAICSPLLSKASFGNYDYTIPFIVLSVTLLLDQLSSGQKVVLQGLRRLKDLAKCSAIGVTFGLIISVPLYYWLGVDGIVPTLLLNSLCALIVSFLYSRKLDIKTVDISLKETFKQGRQMMVMGISMSISSILTTAVAFLIRSYIQSVSGVEVVGLYQAGFVIMTTYVGLIFNAISTDYYPRLAGVNKDNIKCREVVSQQGEIATMILAPLLTLCLIFMPFVLRLLYSERFLGANMYISWACLGMMFRLASWIISFLFVAKAESKLFILNETAANVFSLAFGVVGYMFWGLQGLGIAFSATYLVYFIQVFIIAKKRYSFTFSKDFKRQFTCQLVLVSSCLVTVLLFSGWQKYLLGFIFAALSIGYGLWGLNKKMQLIELLKGLKS